MFSSSRADNLLQAAFPYVSPCTRSFVVAALTVAHRVYALGDECDSVVATASNINLRWLKRCSVGIHVRNAADVEQIGDQVSSAHTVTFLRDNDSNASALGATYEAVARRFPHVRTLQCVALTKHTTPHVAHIANLTALELSSSVDKDCFQNLATTTTIQNTLSRLSFQDDITGFDHIMQCVAELLPNVTDLQTDENVVTTPAGQDALLRVARRLTTLRGISSICNIFCASVANGMKWDAEPLKDIVLSTNAIPSSEDVENVVRQGLLYILDCSPQFNFDGSNDD